MSFILISQGLNILLRNNVVRLFILTVTSVYAGYTLNPVPFFLKKAFDRSMIFKYLILMFGLAASNFPLDESKTCLAIGVPVIVLFLFEMMKMPH
jgi:hypothetical protein